jgi:hypothetical protein
MVPLGAQMPLKPLSRKGFTASLKGSGTGNAVTRGNLFQKNKFWFNENEILFSGKKKGRFYSFFFFFPHFYFSFSQFFPLLFL